MKSQYTVVWAQPLEILADKLHSNVWETIEMACGVFCLCENNEYCEIPRHIYIRNM